MTIGEVKCQYKDLDRGWAFVVLLASFTGLFVMGGTTYSVGIIHSTLLERFHENHSKTSWAGALNTAFLNLAAPLTALLVDTFSVRTAMVCGGVLLSLGYFCSAFAPSLLVTIFTCGVMSGLGGAVIWTSTMVAPGFYFQKYRNMAFGVSLSGTAFGIFGIAPAMQKGKEEYGTSGFFIVLTCITLHVIVCGVAMKPSSLELMTQKKRKQDAYKNKEQNHIVSVLKGYLKILTCKPVVCLALSMFLYCTGIYTVFVYLPSVCVDQGVTQMQASFILAIMGIVSVCARLVTGVISSRVDEIYVYGVTMALSGIITVIFPLFSDTYVGQVMYACIFGLFFGGPYVVISPINIRFVGVSNMTLALGIELCLGGIGTIIGPVLAGHILDKTGSFVYAFLIAGAVIVVGAISGLSTLMFSKCTTCLMEDQSQAKMEIEVDETVTSSLVPIETKNA